MMNWVSNYRNLVRVQITENELGFKLHKIIRVQITENELGFKL